MKKYFSNWKRNKSYRKSDFSYKKRTKPIRKIMKPVGKVIFPLENGKQKKSTKQGSIIIAK